MKKLTIISTLLFMSFFGVSQTEYYSEKNKKKLKSIELMVGDWKGTGWVMNQQSRERETFEQNEKIRFALDSTIIMVEGKGMADGSIVHDAVAIISSNPKGGYFMTSYLGDGLNGKYELKGENGNYEWRIPTEQGDVVYKMTITDKTWKEVGVFEMDGQQFPFFEMNLNKTKK